MQVALAPENERKTTKDGHMNRHHSAPPESIPCRGNTQCLPLLQRLFALFKFFDRGKLKSWWVISLGSCLHKASLCSPLKKHKASFVAAPAERTAMRMRSLLPLWELNERHSVRFTNWGQNRDLMQWWHKEKQHSLRIRFFSFSSKLLCYLIREP